MTAITIKPARPEHIAALRAIELAAFETLRRTGAVNGSPVATSEEDFDQLRLKGVLLAAFRPGGVPVGFVGAIVTKHWLHIAEMDVHPDWQQQGTGRRLLNAMLAEGKMRGLQGATLTTDRFAPFNATFYASLGFTPVEGDALSPRLQTLLMEETHAGLDPKRRIAMQLVYNPAT
ncbi:GNAT family N-acetyltransferase [Mangrovibacter plantisponsor]|uniref:Putative N-acetyltransferase YhbS n=1 Tax=Mangrovibacter plantisponsor TaxID=451513 RepID=A0A317Q6V9_9ENTR|nr:GNAT family N-acetyltransferase [Mangrovibacter plantisponsor]PWW11663.1 putative N-acetyltransferase YhbS [Mangrovibacter plantisponsor]